MLLAALLAVEALLIALLVHRGMGRRSLLVLGLGVALDRGALALGHPLAWSQPLLVLLGVIAILSLWSPRRPRPVRPVVVSAPPLELEAAAEARAEAVEATRQALSDCHACLADSQSTLRGLRQRLEVADG